MTVRNSSRFIVKRTGNDLLDQNFDAVAQAFRALEDDMVPATQLVAGVALNATSTPVYHGLGRVPRGWHVVGITSNAVVYEDSGRPATAAVINLIASNVCTVTLLFF